MLRLFELVPIAFTLAFADLRPGPVRHGPGVTINPYRTDQRKSKRKTVRDTGFRTSQILFSVHVSQLIFSSPSIVLNSGSPVTNSALRSFANAAAKQSA